MVFQWHYFLWVLLQFLELSTLTWSRLQCRASSCSLASSGSFSISMLITRTGTSLLAAYDFIFPVRICVWRLNESPGLKYKITSRFPIYLRKYHWLRAIKVVCGGRGGGGWRTVTCALKPTKLVFGFGHNQKTKIKLDYLICKLVAFVPLRQLFFPYKWA